MVCFSEYKQLVIIVKLIQVYANNIVFTLKIRLFCIKLLIISIFNAIFHLCNIIFSTFYFFIYIIMYILNVAKAIKKR